MRFGCAEESDLIIQQFIHIAEQAVPQMHGQLLWVHYDKLQKRERVEKHL